MRLGEGVVGTKILNSFYSLPSRFKEKHDTKFDYSKVVFEKMLKKVIIICPIHGEFLQTPCDHAKGFGCDKCSREESGRLRSLTNEAFIEKATLKHLGIYDYSKIETIKNSQTKVIILCPIHGEFKQQVAPHLAGTGCPKCGALSKASKNTKTFDSFMERVNRIHGTRYDYSKVVWVNVKTDIEIICPIHGSFIQNPSTHQAGHGCIKCSDDSKRHTADIFIEKALAKHGDKYDYSEVVYKQNKQKVDIICPTHGVFSQRCDIHLAGHGCPHCAKQIPPTERHEFTTTYYYVVKYKGLYKVGVSLEGAKQRYRWEVEDPENLEILTEIEFEGYGKAYTFEQFMLDKYFKYRYFGEPIFRYTGNTEVFTENIYELYLQECKND